MALAWEAVAAQCRVHYILLWRHHQDCIIRAGMKSWVELEGAEPEALQVLAENFFDEALAWNEPLAASFGIDAC